MKFQVIKDPREPEPTEPVVELMLRVADNYAYLCGRPTGVTSWTYLMELGHPDGARLFSNIRVSGLPSSGCLGELKFQDGSPSVLGLPS